MVSRRLEPSSNLKLIGVGFLSEANHTNLDTSIEYCSLGMFYHLDTCTIIVHAPNKCYSKDPSFHGFLLQKVESIDLVCVGIVVFSEGLTRPLINYSIRMNVIQ